MPPSRAPTIGKFLLASLRVVEMRAAWGWNVEGRELKYISARTRALGEMDQTGPLHRCRWRVSGKETKDLNTRVKIRAPGVRSVNR